MDQVTVKRLISVFALAALTGLPLAAQQPSSTPGGSQPDSTSPQNSPANHSDPTQTAQPDPVSTQSPAAGGNGAAVPVPHTANAPEIDNASLRPVNAELASALDTKNAKNGDQVVLKTTEKATTASGFVIPKGSKIVGHVVDVQAHDSNNKNSKLTLQFDQAELKDGQRLPIRSVLQSVSPSSESASDNAMPSGGAMSAPAGSPTGSAAPNGGSPNASGGMTGAPPAAGTPMQGNTGAASPGVATGPAGTPTAGTVIAQQGNIQIKTTAIPGVLIASNASGQPFSNASGALLGAQQNVHLDGGTRVVLAIADANTKASNQ